MSSFLPAVADDDLRGVLVGHDDSGRGESASECVGVVSLEGFLDHARVMVVSHLEVVAKSYQKGNPLTV